MCVDLTSNNELVAVPATDMVAYSYMAST